MASRTAGLSDDWENVEFDNFSVVSLPNSEDGLIGSPPSGRATTSLNPISDASLTSTSPTDAPNGSEDDKIVLTFEDVDDVDEVEKHGMDRTDVVEPCDVVKPRDAGDSLKKVLDVKPHLPFLCDLTDSLKELVRDILVETTFLSQRHGPIDCAMKIKSELDMLTFDLNQLQSVLKTWTKHWNPDRDSQLPIDPGLTAWMSRLKVELVNLQGTLKSTNPEKPLSPISTWVLRMETYLEAITTFGSQIKMFLPVMQADLSEFYTAGLPVLSGDDSVRSSYSRASARPHPTLRPGCSVAHLRRELYALKDQIWSYLREVEAYDQLAFSNTPLDASRASDFRSIKASLDVMLSNHASDWIDYSVSGGLTYPEFCALNPDTIRSLILQLKEASDDVMLARSGAESYRSLYNRENLIRDCGKHLTVKSSTWDMVGTLEEVLRSVLRIRKDDAPNS